MTISPECFNDSLKEHEITEQIHNYTSSMQKNSQPCCISCTVVLSDICYRSSSYPGKHHKRMQGRQECHRPDGRFRIGRILWCHWGGNFPFIGVLNRMFSVGGGLTTALAPFWFPFLWTAFEGSSLSLPKHKEYFLWLLQAAFLPPFFRSLFDIRFFWAAKKPHTYSATDAILSSVKKNYRFIVFFYLHSHNS